MNSLLKDLKKVSVKFRLFYFRKNFRIRSFKMLDVYSEKLQQCYTALFNKRLRNICYAVMTGL